MVQQFILAVDESYKLYDNNRELVERAMRLGSEELEEKNALLEAEKQRQQEIINNLVDAVHRIFPEYTPEQDTDLLRIVDILRDAIETQKAVQQDLLNAREIAEHALETRKQFLANISHEIRTPMNAISGMALLLSDSDLNPSQRDYLNAIITSTDGLMVIINDVLDMSKMESGKFSLEHINFNIDKLIRSIIRGQSVRAREKNIPLRFEQDATLSTFIVGDPTRLTQVLTNLISNAVKFTDKGSVTLSTRVVKESHSTQHIEFAVMDTGIGIDADKLNAIFEEFTQADVSITRKYGGTGLGLSISKSLVELMGGKLNVSSEKGVGSTFSFIIEMPFGKEENETHLVAQEVKDLQQTYVLLVEDNEMNRFLATTLLAKWNAKVHYETNGKRAIEWLRNNDPEVILMDLQMPEMDGFQATQMLRNELKKDIPVIALTANALELERENCLAIGMNDYVSKPYSPDTLYKSIMKNAIRTERVKDTNTSENLHLSLHRLMDMYDGNAVHVKKTADVFLKQMQADMMLLDEKVKQLDYKDIQSLIHKMSPGVELFEITSILHNFKLIREGCTERNAAKLNAQITELMRLMELTRIKLEAEVVTL